MNIHLAPLEEQNSFLISQLAESLKKMFYTETIEFNDALKRLCNWLLFLNNSIRKFLMHSFGKACLP
jgi:hypothetical protein